MRSIYIQSRVFSQLNISSIYRHLILTSLVLLSCALVASAAAQTKAQALSVSDNTINFGNIVVGQTVSQSLTLSSTGNSPVTISGISVAGSLFSATGITTPTTLNPGQTATLNLGFTSPHVSTFTGVVTITSNSSAGNLTINMGAAGVSAALSALSCAPSSV